MQEKDGLSVHHACRIIGQYRGSQRDVSTVPADEDAWTRALVALAFAYGRYGSRRVTALLQAGGQGPVSAHLASRGAERRVDGSSLTRIPPRRGRARGCSRGTGRGSSASG